MLETRWEAARGRTMSKGRGFLGGGSTGAFVSVRMHIISRVTSFTDLSVYQF